MSKPLSQSRPGPLPNGPDFTMPPALREDVDEPDAFVATRESASSPSANGVAAVLALLDACDAEIEFEPFEGGEDGDPAQVHAAWAEEIERRVEEIRSGTTQTYAAEDVIAALRMRFG